MVLHRWLSKRSTSTIGLTLFSSAHEKFVGDGKHCNLGEEARLAYHLIVFLFVVFCVVSILRLKFISGVMHWRQVVAA